MCGVCGVCVVCVFFVWVCVVCVCGVCVCVCVVCLVCVCVCQREREFKDVRHTGIVRILQNKLELCKVSSPYFSTKNKIVTINTTEPERCT